MILVTERKQVGTIYHYTYSPSPLKKIGETGGLKSELDYVSFTRNGSPSMLSYLGKKNARLVFDGTRLSDRFKVEPFLDDGLERTAEEWEERIVWPRGKLLPCLFALVRVELRDVVSIDRALLQSLAETFKVPVVPLKGFWFQARKLTVLGRK